MERQMMPLIAVYVISPDIRLTAHEYGDGQWWGSEDKPGNGHGFGSGAIRDNCFYSSKMTLSDPNWEYPTIIRMR